MRDRRDGPAGDRRRAGDFAEPDFSLGCPPPSGGSRHLPPHAGRKRGLEMIPTGDPIPAARAAEPALGNAVV
ncbi:hypothetical protein AB0D38_26335, partial [Streptomyces sp. NPDC048279]